ncbi:MAG: sodium/glutamate symporter [Clostridia bacterium]|nr:sodium/glutamate symporter [Clostridia bacterium]
MTLNLDIYQTAAVAVFVYALGSFVKKKIDFFNKYCIPASVIGGILFALLTLGLNLTDTMTVVTDTTLQNIFMTLFFTSVGYTASFKLLKKGGVQVLLFLIVASALIVVPNLVGVSLASLLGLDPLMGLCVGSVPLVGGHGTSGAFGPMLEQQFGVSGAATVSIAVATFGLIIGGIIGGPVAKRRVRKHNLVAENVATQTEEYGDRSEKPHSAEEFMKAFFILFVAAGIGSVISTLIQKTGVTFPSYIGAMLAAALLRNLSDTTGKLTVVEDIVSLLGNACLTLYLAMALMSLRLWELANLALPMIVILLAQTIIMALFAYYLVYNVMGRNYEAAVMSSAACGFGMGATPNAIANMQAITDVYGPAPRAFFVVPLVGSLFVDFVNSGVLTIFIHIFS